MNNNRSTPKVVKRSEFIRTLGLLALTPLAMQLNDLKKLTDEFTSTEKMPVLFAGHGNPMNAIQENSFTRGWERMVRGIPTPRAILCISAHWETVGTYVTSMESPRTIHDFGGFPQKLFDVQYPAPGAPEYADLVQQTVEKTNIQDDHSWGLDHGTWSVLIKMFPEADIPVFQMSLDHRKDAQWHYELGQELKKLRKKGVLIIGSGNIVHNLRYANLREDVEPYDWAIEFDNLSEKLINERAHDKLIRYDQLGEAAKLSIPTPEHYLPLLYTLALQDTQEEVQFFNEEVAFRSGSMRSLKIS